jgi:CubicO group peptidase (beta-lactamase class C family)
MKNISLVLAVLFFITSCKEKDTKEDPINPNPQPTAPYFPPVSGTWLTTSVDSLGWNADSIIAMYADLEKNGSRAFIVLQNGKIVLEKYWGKDILKVNNFDATKNWYWASAAKTLTSFAVGKAQEQGKLELTDKTSKYLGEGWTSLTKAQEDKITVWHQLTMTSGLDDGTGNADGFKPSDLKYKADAGKRWAYHNAPYTLLDQVVENAVGQDFEPYFYSILRDKIGMDGFWTWSGDNHLYLSTARSAARFGHLILNNGVWDGIQMLNKSYVEAMTTRSQEINQAYGYLWWLNGTSSYHIPQSQFEFPGSMTPNAPGDMVAAMGKNGQYVCVVPSKNIVVIRMGDSPDAALVPFLYLNDIWGMLNGVMK